MSSLLMPGIALAESPQAGTASVLISELQVAGANSASDEFVEFYNPTGAAIDLKDWKFQYHSASATSDCSTGWTTKATIASGAIAAHSFYLLSSTGYLAAADKAFSSGLASAGSIRLVDGSGTRSSMR